MHKAFGKDETIYTETSIAMTALGIPKKQEFYNREWAALALS